MRNTPAVNLQQLAGQRGDMHWLAAYGHVPTRKKRIWAVCLMVFALLCMAATAALAFRKMLGDYAVFPVNVSLLLLFFAFGLLRRRGKLDKWQQDTWLYHAESRTLHWLDNGREIAGYALSDGDALMAGEHEFHGEAAWIVAYRRPYPKQEVIIFAYVFGKKQDRPAFTAAVENMAANMRLPLDWSWRDGAGRLKSETVKPQEKP